MHKFVLNRSDLYTIRAALDLGKQTGQFLLAGGRCIPGSTRVPRGVKTFLKESDIVMRMVDHLLNSGIEEWEIKKHIDE